VYITFVVGSAGFVRFFVGVELRHLVGYGEEFYLVSGLKMMTRPAHSHMVPLPILHSCKSVIMWSSSWFMFGFLSLCCEVYVTVL